MHALAYLMKPPERELEHRRTFATMPKWMALKAEGFLQRVLRDTTQPADPDGKLCYLPALRQRHSYPAGFPVNSRAQAVNLFWPRWYL